MKRVFIIVYSAFVIIMLANYFYYRSLYNKQISYIFELLARQVQTVGLEVDQTNNGFLSDLNQVTYSEDMTQFFTSEEHYVRAVDKMKLFFTKYEEFITVIRFNDNRKNEFTLKKDSESEQGDWLESKPYIIQVQPEIHSMEKLALENKRYNYYLPVIDQRNNEITGNLVVTVDFQKYFREIFLTYNLEKYQWQWVVSDTGEIVFDNYGQSLSYGELNRIVDKLADQSMGEIVHNAIIDGSRKEIISSYYPAQLLQRDLGLVFSAPTDFFQKYIIRNSLFIVIGTLLLIQVIIYVFWRFLRRQKDESERMKTSEKMLFRLIDEMPVGVIIHDRNREIIKANRVAAEQYSYSSETEMQGKIFPETDPLEDAHQSGDQDTYRDRFIVIKRESGEIVLFKKSIPVVFMGKDSTMEILIDVTLLEMARKQEAKANVAKSEFLARMSYEIRTPLNGVIGMTDVLYRYDLAPEVKEIVRLLRHSTEVLLNFINDILDFSKIETGKMILDEVPFNIRDEISYSIDLAKTNIAPGVGLVSAIDESVPESIIGDPFRLRQILINLLNHSIRNTGDGQITLKCRLKSKKDGVLSIGFELQDTGILFDKASLKKVFGDVIKFESRAARGNDDSAFGTILARQLIELMGGSLAAVSPAESGGDHGTKISFTITAYANERTLKKVPLEKITSFDKIRTLVITGSQNRDEETLNILHQLGMMVTVTTFMKATVNQVKANLNLNISEERYSLIIIFNDDSFNGFDAAAAIWENKLSSNFIMLMVSTNDMRGNYLKCLSLGIDQYLVKPFSQNELKAIIKNNFPSISENEKIPAEDQKNIRILVVEDNKMNQQILGAMLKSLGYSFDIATDGYEGFLKARAKKYELIFMDLMLPEIDGFEASQKILKEDNSVRIVAFSADNMPETRKKAELSGISDFIIKPVRIDELKKIFAKYSRK